MNKVSSGRASTSLDARLRLFSAHPVRLAAAVLMLAGTFGAAGSAYAQASQDTASCIEKCKADEKACIHNGSSEELCDYDSKTCQKACSGAQ